MGHADYYVSAHHEAASKICWSKDLRLIIQQPNRLDGCGIFGWSCERRRPGEFFPETNTLTGSREQIDLC
jgi:hypothetical protein